MLVQEVLTQGGRLGKGQQHEEDGDQQVSHVVRRVVEHVVGQLGVPVAGVLVELGIVLPLPHVQCRLLYSNRLSL